MASFHPEEKFFCKHKQDWFTSGFINPARLFVFKEDAFIWYLF
jgi:hypothetical protein